MKMRGADLVVRALEDEGIRYTFGIPGTHNIELYDALDRSQVVTPVLVTDEQSASFMADGVSRTSGQVGVVNVVPGAGVTHALSGVAEAFMDNVPMLVLACGVRSDTGRAYQVHDVDQLALLAPVTKACFRVEAADEIYGLIRRAFALARAGAPGPVAVEVPANHLAISRGEVPRPTAEVQGPPRPRMAEVEAAARLLVGARHPAIYAGNGTRRAGAALVAVAEALGAPVTTTIQGKGCFPEDHPLWLWNGFGNAAPPFVRRVMDRCDGLLAIGCRFGEVATASYGLKPPDRMVHVDIDPAVLNRNFPAEIAVAADAGVFLDALVPRLRSRPRDEALEAEIAAGHRTVRGAWESDLSSGRVTPHRFFDALQRIAGEDACYVVDSGNGAFLAMEHLRLRRPGCLIGPIDYSCMGYAVPAAIGVKLAAPDRPVVALPGDGALLMTGLELLTATASGVAPIVCVLRDGELGQIAHFMRPPLDRDTCCVLPPYRVEDFARLVGAAHLHLPHDGEIEAVLGRAFEEAGARRPVIVEVAIDYERRTWFTRGVLRTNLLRLSWPDRFRILGRALGRRWGRT